MKNIENNHENNETHAKTMNTNEKDIEKTMKIITNIETHMKNNGKTWNTLTNQ